MATTVTPALFREAYPVFSSTSVYPDTQVSVWIRYADKLLYDLVRWSDMRDDAIMMVVAHQLVLSGRDAAAVAAGGAPGAVTGAVSSKSVGGVSVSYDTSAAVLDSAGYWNLTSYGIQFWQLARIVGVGGFQL